MEALHFVFIRNGRRYDARNLSADFSAVLSDVTGKLPEKLFMLLSDYRHVANAFMKAHLRHQEVKNQLAGESDVRDLQNDHTTKTSDLCYGTTQTHPLASETFTLFFMRASREWHGFLGFPESEQFVSATVRQCLRSGIPAMHSTKELKLAESLSITMARANTIREVQGTELRTCSMTRIESTPTDMTPAPGCISVHSFARRTAIYEYRVQCGSLHCFADAGR